MIRLWISNASWGQSTRKRRWVKVPLSTVLCIYPQEVLVKKRRCLNLRKQSRGVNPSTEVFRWSKSTGLLGHWRGVTFYPLAKKLDASSFYCCCKLLVFSSRRLVGSFCVVGKRKKQGMSLCRFRLMHEGTCRALAALTARGLPCRFIFCKIRSAPGMIPQAKLLH